MPHSSLLGVSAGSPLQSPDHFPFRDLVERMLPINRVRELYRRAQQPVNRPSLENLLSEMRVSYQVANADLARIPTTGPVVVTANHPFGLLDGAILGALVSSVREDVKVITNSLLSGIEELHEDCIFVDPVGTREAVRKNRRSMKAALAWLRGGGLLAIFPAGEVSHLQFPKMEVADPEWNPTVARLIRLSKATAVPVFFRGRSSVTFQAVGALHPRLRTTWLLTEFLQQTDRKIEVNIGSSISASSLCEETTDAEAAAYLRWRTYLLAQRGHTPLKLAPVLRSVLPQKKQEPIAAEVPCAAIKDELDHFRPEQCLSSTREFSVYVAEAAQIPNAIRELGRLRELTFREAGEGTGKSSDLDNFDHYYKHLLLWSNDQQQLVGGYRLGLTAEILPRLGTAGLYTNTLFKFDPTVFDRLGPALELGRSFVRPEYQRQYAPLLMLWKGIGRYLAIHPELAVLFGAVSISSRYQQISRELIVRFFEAREKDGEFTGKITPRHPFRPGWIRPGDCRSTCRRMKDLDELTDPITDVESDGKGVPILLKQYAKLGGRIVSFNVDKNFSDVLDGLVLVDLRQTEPTALERYMGKEGFRAFKQFHATPKSLRQALTARA